MTTREEALDYIEDNRIEEIKTSFNDGIRVNHISYRKCKNLVKKLFDEFEAELEKMVKNGEKSSDL